MFFTALAYAQDAAEGAAEGAKNATLMDQIMGIAPFILIFVVFYFLMIRPQQKRQKQLQETVNSLKSGDPIVTTSGFLGTVEQVIDANTFLISLGGGVKVQILRSGIAGKQTHEPAAVKK